jgi:hypothetical protein
MEKFGNIVFKSVFNNEDKNNITALGMVKLVSMPWTTLKFFNVCNNCNNNLAENNIGNQGAKLLTKAAMPMMERLHLSKYLII